MILLQRTGEFTILIDTLNIQRTTEPIAPSNEPEKMRKMEIDDTADSVDPIQNNIRERQYQVKPSSSQRSCRNTSISEAF